MGGLSTRYNPLRLVPQGGIEPPTSALPKRRSTPELLRLAPEAGLEPAPRALTVRCNYHCATREKLAIASLDIIPQVGPAL